MLKDIIREKPNTTPQAPFVMEMEDKALYLVSREYNGKYRIIHLSDSTSYIKTGEVYCMVYDSLEELLSQYDCVVHDFKITLV